MNEIMQIMKLMEQAPNFSTAGVALFGYCLFFTIKSKAEKQVKEKMDERLNERLKPIEDKVGNIEKNINLLISNICPKNGL
jgi:chaperonin cofactor prefoldin